MDQIKRIMIMEQYLNNGINTIEILNKALDQYVEVSSQIDLLFEYYGSDLWFKDVEDDKQEKLPQDLNRGVLSEDGVWDFMYENRELLKRMRHLEIIGKILDDDE